LCSVVQCSAVWCSLAQVPRSKLNRPPGPWVATPLMPAAGSNRSCHGRRLICATPCAGTTWRRQSGQGKTLLQSNWFPAPSISWWGRFRLVQLGLRLSLGRNLHTLEEVRKFLGEGVALRLGGVLPRQGSAETVVRARQQFLKVGDLAQGPQRQAHIIRREAVSNEDQARQSRERFAMLKQRINSRRVRHDFCPACSEIRGGGHWGWCGALPHSFQRLPTLPALHKNCVLWVAGMHKIAPIHYSENKDLYVCAHVTLFCLCAMALLVPVPELQFLQLHFLSLNQCSSSAA